MLKVRLYRQRKKIDALARLRRHCLMRLVEELRLGTVERRGRAWGHRDRRRSTRRVARRTVRLRCARGRPHLGARRPVPTPGSHQTAKILNRLLGGSIAGLCRSAATRPNLRVLTSRRCSVVPRGPCRLATVRSIERRCERRDMDRVPWSRIGLSVRQRVVFLLRRETLAQLYPDIARRA